MKEENFFYIAGLFLGIITIIYFVSDYIVFLPKVFKVIVSFISSFILIDLGLILKKRDI